MNYHFAHIAAYYNELVRRANEWGAPTDGLWMTFSSYLVRCSP